MVHPMSMSSFKSSFETLPLLVERFQVVERACIRGRVRGWKQIYVSGVVRYTSTVVKGDRVLGEHEQDDRR